MLAANVGICEAIAAFHCASLLKLGMCCWPFSVESLSVLRKASSARTLNVFWRVPPWQPLLLPCKSDKTRISVWSFPRSLQ